jgi:hypothetical protein
MVLVFSGVQDYLANEDWSKVSGNCVRLHAVYFISRFVSGQKATDDFVLPQVSSNSYSPTHYSGGVFMQEFVIKYNRRGKINILVTDLPSQVAHLYLQKACEDNGKRLAFYPLAVNSLDFVKGEDVIVAGHRNNPLGEAVFSYLGVPKDETLKEGAYRIKPINGENNILAIVGGDLAGLLYAISHLESVLRLTPEELIYTGGDISESPAFPYRIYWTWDHSTNWNLDYTGQLDWGCANHPLDSLRDFATAQLSPLVGGEELAQLFIEFLAKSEAQKMAAKDFQKLEEIRQNYYSAVQRGEDFDKYRRWKWLELKCKDYTQESYLPFP